MLSFECGICVFVRRKRDVCYTGESLIWLFRFFAGVLFAPCCAIFRGKRVHLGLLCGGGMDPAPLFVLLLQLVALCVHCTFVLPLSDAERAQSAEGREAQIPRDQKERTQSPEWAIEFFCERAIKKIFLPFCLRDLNSRAHQLFYFFASSVLKNYSNKKSI